jgi:hypothetical protein
MLRCCGPFRLTVNKRKSLAWKEKINFVTVRLDEKPGQWRTYFVQLREIWKKTATTFQSKICNYTHIQSVTEGEVTIRGGHSIGHSKQNSVYIYIYIYTCVLFRTVSEIELFHCTVPKRVPGRFLGGKARPARKADNLTTIYEPIV